MHCQMNGGKVAARRQHATRGHARPKHRHTLAATGNAPPVSHPSAKKNTHPLGDHQLHLAALQGAVDSNLQRCPDGDDVGQQQGGGDQDGAAGVDLQGAAHLKQGGVKANTVRLFWLLVVVGGVQCGQNAGQRWVGWWRALCSEMGECAEGKAVQGCAL